MRGENIDPDISAKNDELYQLKLEIDKYNRQLADI